MRKIALVMVGLIMMSLSLNNGSIHAVSTTSAQSLYELGLLSNIQSTELNKTLDRITGLTMILKTLGYKDIDASRSSREHPFTDFEPDNAWGEGWANIGVTESITTGTSATTFSPNSTISKKEFLAYQLRVLGYSVGESWDNCAKLSEDVGLIGDAIEINDFVRFTKAAAADIMYAALKVKLKDHDQVYLIEKLIADGIVSYDIAMGQKIAVLSHIDMLSVEPITNNKLEIILGQEVSFITPNDFKIVDSQGTKITIVSAALSNKGKTITVVTAVQNDLYTHTITTRDSALSYKPMKIDTIKPRIATVNSVDSQHVKLTFNEKVDLSALELKNYKIAGLVITKIEYELDSSSKSINTNVLITTSAQTINITYKVLVTDVNDLSGNSIDLSYDEASFIGKLTDTTKPKITSVYILSNSLIQVVFSEPMELTEAQKEENYRISGLSIIDAVRQSNTSVVYLTTSTQTEGFSYNLYIYNVKDYENNGIDYNNNGRSFTGKGIDIGKPILVGVISLTNTTIKVTFSESITEETGSIEYAYYLGGELGYPVDVQKDITITDGSVWILTTIPQELKQYTLDVTGVRDMANNTLDELQDTYNFTGIAPVN